MTREEAIKILEYPVKKWSMEWDERGDGLSEYEALDMAISAIRQQEKTPCSRCGYGGKHLDAPPCTTCPAHPKEQRPNEPLTLNEMRKMDGEPVWVEFQDGSGGCWGLVHITVFTHIVFANGHFCTVGKPYYGKTWITYRHKPEEGTV